MSNNIGRRDFLGAVALVGAAAAAGRTSLIDSAEAATASSDGITASSASELAEAVRSKKWSSKEIVEAHLDRIAKVNPKLNAVVQLTAEAARRMKPMRRSPAAKSRARFTASPSPSRIRSRPPV